MPTCPGLIELPPEPRLVATPEDPNPTFRAMLRRLNEQHFHFRRRDFHRHHWLALYEGLELAAFAGMKPVSPSEVHFGLCGVLPEHRGRGLQRRLIVARERLARRAAYKVATTYVDVTNVASATNFLRCGFHLASGKNPDWYLYFRKELS